MTPGACPATARYAETSKRTYSSQCSHVMIFRIGKSKTRLFDCSAIIALKPGNSNNQLDLSTADRKCLENPLLLPDVRGSEPFSYLLSALRR